MRRESAVPLEELLNQLLKDSKLEQGLERARLFKAWEKVVGDNMAKYSSNLYFNDGTLICTISSSVARHLLISNRHIIVERLNRELGSDLVKKLVLK